MWTLGDEIARIDTGRRARVIAIMPLRGLLRVQYINDGSEDTVSTLLVEPTPPRTIALMTSWAS